MSDLARPDESGGAWVLRLLISIRRSHVSSNPPASTETLSPEPASLHANIIDQPESGRTSIIDSNKVPNCPAASTITQSILSINTIMHYPTIRRQPTGARREADLQFHTTAPARQGNHLPPMMIPASCICTLSATKRRAQPDHLFLLMSAPTM
eukprot:764672-Hanusia_phi.AAC.3